MAEPTFPKCPDRPDGPHCWHTIFVASSYQPGQFNSDGMRCCWCGERRPLTIGYQPPIPHGPHKPADPTGGLPRVVPL